MSSDIDIVQRLEAELDDPQGHVVLSTTVDADLLRDAISEIVRLRAERDHAQVQANHLADRLIKYVRRG